VNLFSKLEQRKENPLRVGLIGAGKFAAMYLAQVPRTPGIRLVLIADLAPDNAKANLERVGWSQAAIAGTPIVEDWQ
jgi:predicted homoserine dehydrogenase-like protein